MKIVIISADYPGPDNIYGDVFVHTRIKEYQKYAEVEVIGFNSYLTESRVYEYDGVPVFKTSNLETFYLKVKAAHPDILAGHLIQYHYLDFLLSLSKPMVIFFHGYEVLSWKRRLMNYDTLGSLRYLWPYAKSNWKQRKELWKFVNAANDREDIHFVFVSNWLRDAAQADLKMKFKNAQVIPNGIDTSLFAFEKKNIELRKKILLLRAFKAINYANDIAIEAILILSKKPFFSELEFRIQGEGYLFNQLTQPIKHFDNVVLDNSFIENQLIPSLHRKFGLFLCPSRLDTQGVSMCEAMSSGLVPITCPVGGIPEYATDNVSSFQVDTSQEIADKIEYLYHNPDVFLTMSLEARKSINIKCALPSTIQKETRLFQKLVNPNSLQDLDYLQCSRCLLDVHDDSNIYFDEAGVCSYCRAYELQESKFVKQGIEGEQTLVRLVEQIKKAGIGQAYDCIIGLSGGVDSTYLAYKAKQLGLRPLAVHFDNGWNSELAIKNIENIITKLNFDLYTFVVDWAEFRSLQLAFLKASVVDIELVTDHAIITTLYKLAIKHKIKYILSGTNVVTEAILPLSWIHDKKDHVHIRAINEQFGDLPLKTFPLFNSMLKWMVIWKKIESVSLLNLMPYNKEEVKSIIERELHWRDYGGKHYESVFTRFYQGYILPYKFGIDKRKAHLSNLICSRQLTREQALEEIRKPSYDPAIFKSDYEFVLKKLGLTADEFESIMKLPVKKHTDYPIEYSIYDRFPILKIVRPLWLRIKLIREQA
jgi:N-acetyl sugar amidotransferase